MNAYDKFRFGGVPRLLIAALALMTVAGCGKNDGAGGASGAKQTTVAAIALQEDQFFRLVLFGMREAAAEQNVTLLEGNSGGRPEKEFSLVNTYVTRGVDAILISPVSQEGSVTALKQAHDKGVTIVAYNAPVAGDLAAAYVECSATDLGRQTGRAAKQYINDKLGGTAKVAILAFKSQVPEQSEARVNGFKSQIADMPGVTVVAEQDAWLPEMAVKKAGDILTANPDVDVIYAANEGGTVGAVLAVKNANKAGKIGVFGTDSSEQLLTMLQSDDDVLQAITSQKPVEVGRRAVEDAVKAIRGESVDKVTTLDGTLLSRRDPAGIAAFAGEFKKWTALGSE